LTRWSSAGRGNALWDYQEQVPVSLIATPRHGFVTCRVDEAIADVLERNRAALFDHIPVVQPKSDEIVGVFDAADWMVSVIWTTA